jgi:hypothetical protein
MDTQSTKHVGKTISAIRGRFDAETIFPDAHKLPRFQMIKGNEALWCWVSNPPVDSKDLSLCDFFSESFWQGGFKIQWLQMKLIVVENVILNVGGIAFALFVLAGVLKWYCSPRSMPRGTKPSKMKCCICGWR